MFRVSICNRSSSKPSSSTQQLIMLVSRFSQWSLWIVLSSGMQCCVNSEEFTDVSEESVEFPSVGPKSKVCRKLAGSYVMTWQYAQVVRCHEYSSGKSWDFLFGPTWGGTSEMPSDNSRLSEDFTLTGACEWFTQTIVSAACDVIYYISR